MVFWMWQFHNDFSSVRRTSTFVWKQCFETVEAAFFQVQNSGAGQTTPRRFKFGERQPIQKKSIFSNEEVTHAACLARNAQGGQSFFGGISPRNFG